MIENDSIIQYRLRRDGRTMRSFAVEKKAKQIKCLTIMNFSRFHGATTDYVAFEPHCIFSGLVICDLPTRNTSHFN